MAGLKDPPFHCFTLLAVYRSICFLGRYRSGRSSSRGTPVNHSTWMMRCVGTRFQFQIDCRDTPTFLANAEGPPARSMAFCRAFMRFSVTIASRPLTRSRCTGSSQCVESFGFVLRRGGWKNLLISLIVGKHLSVARWGGVKEPRRPRARREVGAVDANPDPRARERGVRGRLMLMSVRRTPGWLH